MAATELTLDQQLSANVKERRESDHAARQEAYSLVRAMRQGVDVSDCLAVPEKIQDALEHYCEQEPAHAYIVRNALTFRERVREYVDLILGGQDWGAEYAEEQDESEADTAKGDSSEADDPAQGEEESAAPETEAQNAEGLDRPRQQLDVGA